MATSLLVLLDEIAIAHWLITPLLMVTPGQWLRARFS